MKQLEFAFNLCHDLLLNKMKMKLRQNYKKYEIFDVRES